MEPNQLTLLQFLSTTLHDFENSRAQSMLINALVFSVGLHNGISVWGTQCKKVT